MTIDRTALRALAQKAREDAKLVDQIVGDVGTYEAVEMADGIDELLAEVERLEKAVQDERSESDTWFVAGQRISQESDDKIADLELRLHIATETNVADRRLLKTTSDQADEFAAENSRLRVELGEAKLVIEQQDKDADRLRTALTDACACWRNPCLTAREKERHIEILAMLDE